MGRCKDESWYKKALMELINQYGDVPPPWVFDDSSHPYSMRWRMGAGETLIMVFNEWWESENKSELERVGYFKKWPPPPRWTAWMAEVMWDLAPWECEEEFDYGPYFKKLATFGFEGIDDYEADLNNEKWVSNKKST